MSAQANAQAENAVKTPKLAALGLAALGVVFGDIGTSPLYTLKTVLDMTGAAPSPEVVMGVLSLLLWTLIIVTSIKYVMFAMSVDNDGEGGILALMALLGMKKHNRPMIVAFGLFGAALIYGDGAITPAISVLSALEGPEDRHAGPAALSCRRRWRSWSRSSPSSPGHGADRRAFGPVMLVWFVAHRRAGAARDFRPPGSLAAFNPLYAIRFLAPTD